MPSHRCQMKLEIDRLTLVNKSIVQPDLPSSPAIHVGHLIYGCTVKCSRQMCHSLGIDNKFQVGIGGNALQVPTT